MVSTLETAVKGIYWQFCFNQKKKIMFTQITYSFSRNATSFISCMREKAFKDSLIQNANMFKSTSGKTLFILMFFRLDSLFSFWWPFFLSPSLLVPLVVFERIWWDMVQRYCCWNLERLSLMTLSSTDSKYYVLKDDRQREIYWKHKWTK